MPVTVSECEKILGVFVDNDLSFKTHIFTAVKKARQTCNILSTAINGVDNIILISLYKIYIRSIINYTSIVYSPYFTYLINIIENVQRNFNKRLASLSNLSYVERLNVCNLEPFELRRIKMGMLLVYILLHGCVKCNLLDYVEISTDVRNTKENLFKLNKSHAKVIMQQTHFIIRCINNWNSLRNNIVCASTCAVFKRQLMAYTNINLIESMLLMRPKGYIFLVFYGKINLI